MANIFSQLNLFEFDAVFSTDEQCLKYLADEKWKDGFVCRKCGHTNYCQGKTPYSRRCTRCKTDESATAHTIFHRCKIPLHEAFKIAYLVCGEPDISSYDLSRTLDKRQMTCWKFKKKISECLQSKGTLNLVEIHHPR
ncbi:MAG TPA: transposase [Bacteroidales bacterium]|nr:transposase [Bacteroidales bacterium]HRW95893.1 transposase [Bacteroidales bacterium]